MKKPELPKLPPDLHIWTALDDQTDVMRVPGGALYRTLHEVIGDDGKDGMGVGVSAALCFVPMPDDVWLAIATLEEDRGPGA